MSIIFLYTTDKNEHGFMEIVTNNFNDEIPFMRMKAILLDIEFKREDINNLSLGGEELYVYKTQKEIVIKAHISDRTWRMKYQMDWIDILLPLKQEIIQTNHRRGNLQYIMYDEPFKKAQCIFEITSSMICLYNFLF